MNPVKSLTKRALMSLGLKVSRRDLLEEQIPSNYLRSPYLPRIYRENLGRLLCFKHMMELTKELSGDIVECGVSTGHGLLVWALLTELSDGRRRIWGFDSFAGFPPATEADRKADHSFQTHEGCYSSPPEIVLKVLEDGRVTPDFVRQKVRLVKGYFDRTLPQYDGTIALLHLDCDLHQSYQACLSMLYPKVVKGGVILFDEYNDVNFPGAALAIDEFFRNRTERPIRYCDYGYEKYYVVKKRD